MHIPHTCRRLPLIFAAFFLLAACGPSGGGDDDTTDAGMMSDAVICSDTQKACGNTCVDLMTNGSHCGTCGNACTGGTYCSQGSCLCINQDAKKCGGACIDTDTSNDHCGTCGNECPAGSKCEDGSCEQLTVVEKVIEETNEVRTSKTDCGRYGDFPPVDPVQGNPHLHEAAQMHSDRMARYDFFAHDDPRNDTNFADRIGMTPYAGQPVGENIARGQRTAEQVVTGWRMSDGHCRNMMNRNATEIGVGYALDDNGNRGPYWTQVFGRQ